MPMDLVFVLIWVKSVTGLPARFIPSMAWVGIGAECRTNLMNGPISICEAVPAEL